MAEMSARDWWFRLLARGGYRRLLVLERDLRKPTATRSQSLPCTVTLLRETDVERFIAFRQVPNPALFLRRLRDGHSCYSAIVGGRIASVSWVATDSATLWNLNADFSLAADEVYVYDSYTHPDFRGCRLQAVLFRTLHDDLRGKGFRRALTFVSPENRANLRSRGRVGFSVCGIVRRFGLGPVHLFMPTGRCPDLRRHKA